MAGTAIAATPDNADIGYAKNAVADV